MVICENFCVIIKRKLCDLKDLNIAFSIFKRSTSIYIRITYIQHVYYMYKYKNISHIKLYLRNIFKRILRSDNYLKSHTFSLKFMHTDRELYKKYIYFLNIYTYTSQIIIILFNGYLKFILFHLIFVITICEIYCICIFDYLT